MDVRFVVFRGKCSEFLLFLFEPLKIRAPWGEVLEVLDQVLEGHQKLRLFHRLCIVNSENKY